MVVFNRWVTLVAGMYMMMVSGTIYLFPDYSTVLKTSLGYSVEHTNFVGTMLNTGTWAGVIGGLFYDRFGPRLTAIIGSIIVSIGYFFMFLSANQTIGGNAYSMGFFAFLAGQGSGWLYTTALNTNASNFTTEDRGKILGLLTCCFGLCSGIFTLFYNSFFESRVATFLGFLAIVIPVVGIAIGAVFCNYLTMYPKNYETEKKRILIGYGVLAAIIFVLCSSTLVTNATNTKPVYFCGAILVLILALSVLPFRTETGFTMSPTAAKLVVNETNTLIADDVGNTYTYRVRSSINSNAKSITDFVHIGQEMITSTSEKVKVGRKWGKAPDSEDQTVSLPFWKVLRTFDFYLLFFCFFANIGAGITILNNINELVISLEDVPMYATIEEKDLRYYTKYIVTFVVLFSVFNTLGRLTVGMLSDRFLERLSRSSWLIIISAVMAATQVYFLVTDIPGMFGAIFLLGISYGGTFSTVPTLTSELFGLKYFGANYGFVGLAPALGSELISVLIAGALNDKFKAKYYINLISNGQEVKSCIGRECYRYTLFVTLGLCCLAIISASILSYRQRRHKGYMLQP